MRKLFAFLVVLSFLTPLLAVSADKPQETTITGKVAAVDAKAGTLKLKGNDGKEYNLTGTSEQLADVDVDAEVKVVAEGNKIKSVEPAEANLPEEVE